MNQIEQGKLFIAAQRRYKGWAIKQVSGYVHGVVDGLNREEPQEIYVQRLRKTGPDVYATGYVTGFIEAQGSDTVLDLWVISEFIPTMIKYRWWEKSGISS